MQDEQKARVISRLMDAAFTGEKLTHAFTGFGHDGAETWGIQTPTGKYIFLYSTRQRTGLDDIEQPITALEAIALVKSQWKNRAFPEKQENP